FFSSRRRHTRFSRDWSSDVCSSDLGDVIVPYVIAACVIAALGHRKRGGAGCHIDASMYEICVQQMADAIEAAQRGDTPRRMGNRSEERRVGKEGRARRGAVV